MKDKKKLYKEIRSWVLVIIGAFVFAFFINSEVMAKVIVEQSSMENTLFENQQLIIDEISYKFKQPEHGDIIIFLKDEKKGNIIDCFFRYTDGFKELFTGEDLHTRYVKRVIGVEGDVIDIKDGYVYVNGVKQDEPYTNGITETRQFPLPYTVGKNELFVMGDHRTVSQDSRAFGPISMDQVEGKAVYRVYPFNKMGKIK